MTEIDRANKDVEFHKVMLELKDKRIRIQEDTIRIQKETIRIQDETIRNHTIVIIILIIINIVGLFF